MKGSLQKKHGKYYVVVYQKDENGKHVAKGYVLKNKVWSRTLSPRVSKSRLRRVSSSCPSKGAWDKGVVRRNLIMTRGGSERS